MAIQKWLNDQNIEAVQDRRDGKDYWMYDNLYTEIDLIELLEAFSLHVVSQRSELLKVEDKDVPFYDYIKRFFKKPKMELIYRRKRNNSMMTESQLIKYYKRAMCL